jgi:hypothetical protein
MKSREYFFREKLDASHGFEETPKVNHHGPASPG